MEGGAPLEQGAHVTERGARPLEPAREALAGGRNLLDGADAEGHLGQHVLVPQDLETIEVREEARLRAKLDVEGATRAAGHRLLEGPGLATGHTHAHLIAARHGRDRPVGSDPEIAAAKLGAGGQLRRVLAADHGR